MNILFFRSMTCAKWLPRLIKKTSRAVSFALLIVCASVSLQTLAKTSASSTINASAAHDNAAIVNAQECTAQRSPSERLACFDRLYNTPIYTREHTDKSSSPLSDINTLTSLIMRQEAKRSEKDIGLLSSTSLEYAEAEQERVIISVPALAALGVRPLLSASCSDNITRLQLIFSKPLKAHRVNITLRNAQKEIITSYPWRVSEQGYVLDAGRGIPSIQLLQKLLTTKRLYIESSEAVIDGIHFDITQLNQHIKPLQRACDWQSGVANRD